MEIGVFKDLDTAMKMFKIDLIVWKCVIPVNSVYFVNGLK